MLLIFDIGSDGLVTLATMVLLYLCFFRLILFALLDYPQTLLELLHHSRKMYIDNQILLTHL